MGDARILVVDDERFFREAIRDALAPAGLQVELAATGEEALEKLADPSLGVMVLDLQLPDVHGLEVFRRAARIRPELRVVILSAHTEQQYVLEALRLGACDYLAKPLHEEELVLAVRRAQSSFAMEAGWNGLRERVGRLENAISSLWDRASAPTTPSPAELRELVVRTVSEVLGADKTSLLLQGEGPGELRVAAAHGRVIPGGELDPVRSGEGAGRRRAGPLRVDPGGGPRAGRALPEPRAGSAATTRPPSPWRRSSPARTRSACSARPTARDGPMDADDLALLRILAQQAARLLDRPEPAAAEPEALAEPELLDEEEAHRGHARRRRARRGAGARDLRGRHRRGGAAAHPRGRARTHRPLARRGARLALPGERGARRAGARGRVGRRREERPRAPAARRGLTGFVFESGGIVASAAPASDSRFAPAVDTPDDGVARSLVCGPIRFRGRTLGVFRAFPESGAEASPALAELLSAALSAAVRNVLLYRSLVQTIEEVAVARREGGTERASVRARGPEADRQGRGPDRGAALHPALPRQDHRHQIRRPRHDRRGPARVLRGGRGAAQVHRAQAGDRARRRPADRAHARAPRHHVVVREGPPRHRRRHHGGGRDGARRLGEPRDRRADPARRRAGDRPHRQRRPHAAGAAPRRDSAASARSSRWTRR